MTFQRATARRIIALVRSLTPDVRIVVGGYDPSLAPEAWTHPDLGVDVIVRGEGERDVPRAAPRDRAADAAVGRRRPLVSRRRRVPRNAAAADRAARRRRRSGRPTARARVLSGYTLDGPAGRRRRNLARLHVRLQLLLDHRDARPQLPPLPDRARDRRHPRRARARRAQRSSSSTTTSRSTSTRFEALCHAIIDAGLNDIDYLVQGMTAPIAAHGDELAPLMRRAGFRYVFLGIENVLDEDLAFLKARAKNSRASGGPPTATPSLDRGRRSCTATACSSSAA